MRHGEEEQWDSIQLEYVRVIRETTGATPDIALKAASTMVRLFRQRFAGAQLYVSRPPQYDELAVLKDIRASGNVAQVCGRHAIHKSTLYRIVARAARRGEPVPALPPAESAAAAPATPQRKRDDNFNW